MKFADIKQETKEGNWECSYSLSRLVKNISDFEQGIDTLIPLQMNPDFQRGHVWSEEQQEKYIETLLRNGAKNARTIYLNCPSWNSVSDFSDKYNDFVCVDGLQRYTAIKKFVNDELKVFGYYFHEFEDWKIFSRKTSIIKLNINDLKTKKEVLQWYLEMNSNGTPHSKEEIDKVKAMLEEE